MIARILTLYTQVFRTHHCSTSNPPQKQENSITNQFHSLIQLISSTIVQTSDVNLIFVHQRINWSLYEQSYGEELRKDQIMLLTPPPPSLFPSMPMQFRYPSHEKALKSKFCVRKGTCLQPCLKFLSSARKTVFQSYLCIC